MAKIVLVYTDITARKASEEALREAELRLKTIVNTVQAGILVIESETRRIVDANDKALQIVGCSRNALIGSDCHEHLCPAQHGRCPILEGEQVLDNLPCELRASDGRQIPILKSATTLVLGSRSHVLESFIDISGRICQYLL